MKKFLVVALMLALAAPASAYNVTFDEPIPAGVTVQYFDGGEVGPIDALPVANAVPLKYTTSTVPGGGLALLTYETAENPDFGDFGVLVTYDRPQRLVSAVGNDFGGDPVQDNEVVYLSAFDSNKNFLGSASFSGPFVEFADLKPVAIFSLSENIKYVAFTWDTDLGYYAVDNIINCLTCPPVPVPGTFVLLGTALVGLVGMGLRKM